MMIHEITAKAGAHKKRKRIGRGIGSGHGKTSGRGHKGAGSRSGHSARAGYEGGQMPFFRRIAKRGFSNAMFMTVYTVVNIKSLDARFEDGAEVNADMLVKAGLLGDTKQPVKILGTGETKKKLQVTAAAFSESAKQKIEAAGGSVTVAS
ncbi:50S ribosomal protein L15 [Phycisphaerales bacterium AB-hyl4]|uniref:Large ribosomal subunit protein uL15 n=1 Tax=Natronomicrosphaera hydrolytica TaxID=3242702 RepID=A0ABV4U7A7_9BACT